MTLIEEMRNCAAVMRMDERRVLTIAFKALLYSKQRSLDLDLIEDRIAELNREEDERYDAEQERCAGVNR